MFNSENQNYDIVYDDNNTNDDISDPKGFFPFLAQGQSRLTVVILYVLSIVLLSGILFGIAILWQWRVDLLAICNAFYFSSSIFLAFSLIVYASNNNIFAPLVYGTKTFFLMFVGKRPKLTYYDYFQDNKNHQMPKFLIFYPIIASLPNLAVAIILHVIYNTQVYPYL
jgi:hypothetical protein